MDGRALPSSRMLRVHMAGATLVLVPALRLWVSSPLVAAMTLCSRCAASVSAWAMTS